MRDSRTIATALAFCLALPLAASAKTVNCQDGTTSKSGRKSVSPPRRRRSGRDDRDARHARHREGRDGDLQGRHGGEAGTRRVRSSRRGRVGSGSTRTARRASAVGTPRCERTAGTSPVT
jgi:hypothetical protein